MQAYMGDQHRFSGVTLFVDYKGHEFRARATRQRDDGSFDVVYLKTKELRRETGEAGVPLSRIKAMEGEGGSRQPLPSFWSPLPTRGQQGR